MIKPLSILLFSLLVLAGCQNQPSPVADTQTQDLPESLSKILEAHGGLEKWRDAKTLSFTLDGAQHVIDLTSRMAKVESPTKSFGFDGDQVWVAPDSLSDGNERFLYNLYFYFFAMPFVLADPGIQYEQPTTKQLNGVEYDALKITYADSVGDSPKDEYIILSDPQTHRMEWLMYTATFGSSESSQEFNLIRYAEWQEFGGIHLSALLQWMALEGDSTMGIQGEAKFENVQISAVAMPKSFYSEE